MTENRYFRLFSASIFIFILSTTTASAQSFLDQLFGPIEEPRQNYNHRKNYSYTKRTSRRYYVSFPRRYRPGQIVVSFGDRRLYFINKRGRAQSYPIAIPANQALWSGRLRVTNKKINPPWIPTRRMRREDPRLPAYVPGGHPRNPLGRRALYLGNTLYRIHGTDSPRSIGRAVSKGCIRMLNKDVIDLYRKVPLGTEVIVTWRRFHS